MPSAFRSVPVVYPGSWLGSSDILGAALPQRLELSVVDTFAYLGVASEHFYSSRFGSHVFRGGGNPSTAAAGNDFAWLGCITLSRCCWQACTVSIDGLHISYYSCGTGRSESSSCMLHFPLFQNRTCSTFQNKFWTIFAFYLIQNLSSHMET